MFGAAVGVLPFDDFDDVVAACNDSRYGLQAGLFTHDIRRIVTAWRELEVGGLVVNGSSNFRLDHVPFGGVKDSGFGRESPRWMIDDYTVVKTLLLRGMSLFGDQEDADERRQSRRDADATTVTAAEAMVRPARVVRRRVRLRHLRAHQHRAAGRAWAAAASGSSSPGTSRPPRTRPTATPAPPASPASLLVHVGPGMTNAVTGVLTAALDSVPLVAIAGDIPSYYHGRHPHQEVNLHADADQTAIYRPFVKRAWQVHRVADLARFTERAFWTATSGRPGAVLLSVPMDHFSRPVPRGHRRRLPARGAGSARPCRPTSPTGSPTLLVAAERPLVYLGGGLRRGPGLDALRALVEHLDIPVAHSLMAKGTLPDEPSAAARHAGLLGPGADQPVHPRGRRRAGPGDPVRRDRRQLLGPPLHLAVPARPAHPDRHRPGRDRPQLPGRDRRGRRRHRRGAGDRRRPSATGSPTPRRRHGLRETHHRDPPRRCSPTAGSAARSDAVPAAARADPRPTCGPSCRPTPSSSPTSGWNKNGVAQCYELPDEGRFITPGGASTMGFGPAAAVGVQIAAARPHRGRPDRRRRDERPAAGACRWPSSRARR